MTKERQTAKKEGSSWWTCCFTTPQSPSSSPSRHAGGVSPIHVAAEEISPIDVGDGGVSSPPRIEPTPPINIASSSHSAVTAAEETELEETDPDNCLEKLATLIVNKLREIKGLKLKDVPKEGQETNLSWDFLKINSDHLKDLKEIVDEGTKCAESLRKYIPEHGGKDVTHAVTPILAGIGSYHWITFGLLLVGKTLERWEAVTENKEECLRLLEEMAGLALILKQIRDRKMQNQNMKALINAAVERVFNGYFLCCYHMSSSLLRRSCWILLVQSCRFSTKVKKTILLKADAIVTLTPNNDIEATAEMFPINYDGLAKIVVKKDDTIFITQYLFIGSGTSSVWLKVAEIKGQDVVCSMKNSGTLPSILFTMHVCGASIGLPILSENDKHVISTWGVCNNIDILSLSFAQGAEDIRSVHLLH